jgi:hypothetical protein
MKDHRWIERWEKTLKAIKSIGGEVNELTIGKRASLEEVLKVENNLGYKLPECFRQVLLEFSSKVDFYWSLEDTIELPNELEDIFDGNCNWNINNICEIIEEKNDWVKNCFSNEHNEYDRVWHNKLAFLEVGNGDYIAFDLKNYPSKTPVVYLSHDDGEGHGYILGDNFIDFMDRWTKLGCPGTECDQMVPFVKSKLSGIDPNCENGQKWRELIGLDI